MTSMAMMISDRLKVLCAILLLTLSSAQDIELFSFDDESRIRCVNEPVTFTCTTNGNVLTWTLPGINQQTYIRGLNPNSVMREGMYLIEFTNEVNLSSKVALDYNEALDGQSVICSSGAPSISFTFKSRTTDSDTQFYRERISQSIDNRVVKYNISWDPIQNADIYELKYSNVSVKVSDPYHIVDLPCSTDVNVSVVPVDRCNMRSNATSVIISEISLENLSTSFQPAVFFSVIFPWIPILIMVRHFWIHRNYGLKWCHCIFSILTLITFVCYIFMMIAIIIMQVLIWINPCEHARTVLIHRDNLIIAVLVFTLVVVIGTLCTHICSLLKATNITKNMKSVPLPPDIHEDLEPPADIIVTSDTSESEDKV